MSNRILALLSIVLLSIGSACIPGIDSGGVADESVEGNAAGLEEQASDWFLYNKVGRLPYEPLPPLAQDGALPRSIGDFSLLGFAPPEGKEYRDKQKIYYIEETSKNRRLRIFSRDDKIFRIQALTRLTELTDNVDSLEQRITSQYGSPNHESEAERLYADTETVLLFSISREFLVTDLMDVSTCELPRHVLEVVETARETR